MGCETLQNIYVDKGNAYYFSQDGVLYNKDTTVLIAFPGGRKGAFSIPDSVVRIRSIPT